MNVVLRLVAVVVCVATAGCGGGTRDAAVVEASIDKDGRTLYVGLASCNGELAYSVDETGADVRLAVQTTDEPEGDACMDGITVTLQEELGSRRLIDGTTDEPVEVGPPE